jgi:NAD+ synthase
LHFSGLNQQWALTFSIFILSFDLSPFKQVYFTFAEIGNKEVCFMDAAEFVKKLVPWIKGQIKVAGAKGAVLGLSGGIDSAVAAVLCKKALPENTFCINLPCHSNPEDQEHARLIAKVFGIDYKVIFLDDLYDNFLKLLPSDKVEPSLDRLALSNLKVRLRMTTLYYHANRLNYLVVGSSNRSELTVGYFTKWGDGGVDMMPIANLVKQEVVEVAKYLGIPQAVIDKPPSAGLWGGQTDEAEMGITYKDLDRYILTGEADARVKARILSLNKSSEHKRTMPPKPPEW